MSKKNSNSIDDILSKASMCYASTNEQKKEDAFALFQKVLELDPTNLRAINGVGNCYKNGFGVEKDLLVAQRLMSSAEGMFYQRLMEGDFYQKRNLEHVLDVLAKIRKEISTEVLPDLSWAGYNE